jgi:hypothetical protein
MSKYLILVWLFGAYPALVLMPSPRRLVSDGVAHTLKLFVIWLVFMDLIFGVLVILTKLTTGCHARNHIERALTCNPD